MSAITPQLQEQRKAALLNAALREFAEYGYEQASTNRIAKELWGFVLLLQNMKKSTLNGQQEKNHIRNQSHIGNTGQGTNPGLSVRTAGQGKI